MAFYEARGAQGLHELELTHGVSCAASIQRSFTICDAKRADIGNTNRGYVESIFDGMGFDAITLHPYLGGEALAPFLERADKACIVLCRTSNPGAGELQDLRLRRQAAVAARGRARERRVECAGNCMLVVGATYPDEMRSDPRVAPEIPFLVPGVGAQGGDVAAVVRAGLDARGQGSDDSALARHSLQRRPCRGARKLARRDQRSTRRRRMLRVEGTIVESRPRSSKAPSRSTPSTG